MFTAAERDEVQSLLIGRARSDPRVVAAALVGGSAGTPDRWSDIDLTMGVAPDVPVGEVLDAWTSTMREELGAAVLFDLPHKSSIYRVFLLPGALQVDLSFTPAADFGALGPRFMLLFGEAVDRPWAGAPSEGQTLGLSVHHLVRASICLRRGRLWQAETWIHMARDEALALACLRRGLESSYGRGVDRLPEEVLRRFANTFPGRIEQDELQQALRSLITGLEAEAENQPEMDRLRPMLALL